MEEKQSTNMGHSTSALKTLQGEKPDTKGYIFCDSADGKCPEQANPQRQEAAGGCQELGGGGTGSDC